MLFRCGCPRDCPTRNYRVNCTVEMLCDLVPRENMHIHANEPSEKPTSPEAMEKLPVVEFGHDHSLAAEDGCVVCQEHFVLGELTTQLPCGHTFHRECVMPWLEKHNTCPTCRMELPAAPADEKKKNTVVVGEGEVQQRGEATAAASEQEGSALEDFLLGGGETEEQEQQQQQQQQQNSTPAQILSSTHGDAAHDSTSAKAPMKLMQDAFTNLRQWFTSSQADQQMGRSRKVRATAATRTARNSTAGFVHL